MLTLDSVADFTWDFGHEFHLRTSDGNYIWSDPGYPGGDNTIRPTKLSYSEWIVEIQIPFGRDKGTHTIRGYCGEDVKILEE